MLFQTYGEKLLLKSCYRRIIIATEILSVFFMFLIAFEFRFTLDNVESAEIIIKKEQINTTFLSAGMLEIFNPIQ